MKKIIAVFMLCFLLIPSFSVYCENESAAMQSFNSVTDEEINQLINSVAVRRFEREKMTWRQAEQYIKSDVYLNNIKTAYGNVCFGYKTDCSSLSDFGFNENLGKLIKDGHEYTIQPTDLSLIDAAKMYLALKNSFKGLINLRLEFRPGYDENAIFNQITDEEVLQEIEQDKEYYETLMKIDYYGDATLALSYFTVSFRDLNQCFIWPQEIGLDGEVVALIPYKSSTIVDVYFNKDYESLEQLVFDFYKIKLAIEKSENVRSIAHALIKGDVNGDGVVNGKDSLILKRYIANWKVSINNLNADLDGNGKVNGKDSLSLRKFVANW